MFVFQGFHVIPFERGTFGIAETVIEEHRIQIQIQDLQEARAAGCHTSGEAERYIELRRKREAKENARNAKDNSQTGRSGKLLQRASNIEGNLDRQP